MTRYEKGFLTKCAEYGLSEEQANGLMKMAFGVGPVSKTLWAMGKGFGSGVRAYSGYLQNNDRRIKEPAKFQAKADRIGQKIDSLGPASIGSLPYATLLAKHTAYTDAANEARMRNAKARARGVLPQRQFKDDGQW